MLEGGAGQLIGQHLASHRIGRVVHPGLHAMMSNGIGRPLELVAARRMQAAGNLGQRVGLRGMPRGIGRVIGHHDGRLDAVGVGPPSTKLQLGVQNVGTDEIERLLPQSSGHLELREDPPAPLLL